ncbi:MAG: glycogen/starch/alpha-glucan family phosphorylase, partial [Planctomycetia bacterium]
MPTPPPSYELREAIVRHALCSLGESLETMSPRDRYFAVALGLRDRLLVAALETTRRYQAADAKHVFYLSMEFLMGRALGNNLANAGLLTECQQVVADLGLGIDLDEILDEEPDAGLGNGGLGRLAACFLDSLATLGIPGFGYGVNYTYGMFRQAIIDGRQVENPDNWLQFGTPWLIERPDEALAIPMYGRVEWRQSPGDGVHPFWVDTRTVLGIPQDMPIVGYGGKTVNMLRLFSARASNEFDVRIFNDGDYLDAVQQKVLSETISKVLYPDDRLQQGRELRLVQEYFLVACALRDILKRFDFDDFRDMPSKVAIQLNDTHPALAVVELQRILVDEKLLPWDVAWEITTKTLAYTNHTLMPEALERWPVPLMGKVLPRHLELIFEINRRFLDHVGEVRPNEPGKLARVSIIEEGPVQQVRMAHLAMIGGHGVNGVAALHSELVKTRLAPDFYDLWPEKFSNKTNGVTQRRWLLWANPGLADLVTQAVGDGWIVDMEKMRGLEKFADDSSFLDAFLAVKKANKQRLAKLALDVTGVGVDPAAMLDAQVKRIHEYKRQLLNILHMVHWYLKIADDGVRPAAPRTFVVAGKAAPGYVKAKMIVRLVHQIADVVNRDPRVHSLIKIVFL